MTEGAPALLSLTAADLTFVLRNLTIEIVAACSEADDPQSRQLCQRLRRIADRLGEMQERAHSPMLKAVIRDLAEAIDPTP